jgi:hypothetical protein
MVFYNQQHYVPLERTVEIIEDLYGQSISEGTIVEACNEISQQVEPVVEAMKTGGENHAIKIYKRNGPRSG